MDGSNVFNSSKKTELYMIKGFTYFVDFLVEGIIPYQRNSVALNSKELPRPIRTTFYFI